MASGDNSSADVKGESHIEPLSGAEREIRPRGGDECSVDRVLAGWAEAQHGVVSRRQLLDIGVGRRTIGGRLERGALHLVHRGVYAVGHSILSAHGRWMAAVLSCGPGAVLSHRSAAELWGIAQRSGRAIEVTRKAHVRGGAGIVAHQSSLAEDERTIIEGIPVTTTPRTMLDFAAVATKRQVERALNEVEVQGLTDRLSVPDLLERYPRRRGSALLRALLDEGNATRGVTKSELEERFAALLDSRGLPLPRLNADVAVAGRFFSVDCLWQRERLIVELDGRAVHGTRQAFESDRERDRLLTAAGWRVMRVTWRQLRDREAAVAADVRRALGHRVSH